MKAKASKKCLIAIAALTAAATAELHPQSPARINKRIYKQLSERGKRLALFACVINKTLIKLLNFLDNCAKM